MTRPDDGARGRALPVPPAPTAGAPPYGAAELKRLARPHLVRALVGASALHLAAIGLGAALVHEPPVEAAPPPPIQVGYRPPPSVQDPPRPTPPSGTTAPAPRSSTVTPVPDPQAPPDTARVVLNPFDPTGPGNATPGGPGGGTPGAFVPAPPVVEVAPVVEPPTLPERVDRPAPETFLVVEQMPVPVEQVQPTYPAVARAAGLEGRVFVKVRVDETGRVTDVRVARSDNGVFDASAVEAVRQWRFSPGVQAGEPVVVWVTIPVRFRITGR